jgi:ParB-like chromosome segregation protein Spo0J
MQPVQQLESWPTDSLIEYARNARNNDHAVDRVAAAIREFGFRVPILAKSDKTIVDGHLRLKAAKKLGLEEVPVLLCDDMTDVQVRAFRLSVNKVSEFADWDSEMLRVELDELGKDGFDIELTGFSLDEVATLLINGSDFEPGSEDDQGQLDKLDPKMVTCPHCSQEFDSREQG